MDEHCEQYYCRQCVLHLEKQNGPCPMAECGQLLSLKKVQKAIATLYQGMKFKCAGCAATYQYNEHATHKSYCLLQAQACIF